MSRGLGKQWIAILILTLITVVVWTVYSIYSAFVSPWPVDVAGKYLVPVSSDINTAVLEKLTRSKNLVQLDNNALGIGNSSS